MSKYMVLKRLQTVGKMWENGTCFSLDHCYYDHRNYSHRGDYA